MKSNSKKSFLLTIMAIAAVAPVMAQSPAIPLDPSIGKREKLQSPR